jgi:DNA-binding PadR family transcriptional regulator
VEGYWETEATIAADGSVGAQHAAPERKGPRRRYYRLTARGVEALRATVQDWQTFSQAVNHILGGNTIAEGNGR